MGELSIEGVTTCGEEPGKTEPAEVEPEQGVQHAGHAWLERWYGLQPRQSLRSVLNNSQPVMSENWEESHLIG